MSDRLVPWIMYSASTKESPVFSSWQATIAKADIRLSLIGMPTYASVRPEAEQGHNQGWHR